MTPANEPGLPVPEEPEPLQDSAESQPEAVADVEDGGSGRGAGDRDGGVADAGDPTPDAATRAAESEAEAARERAAFDELVASFHSETAPDPVPRKIIRHPVLNPDPVWDQPIIEPTDETTVDKYFASEHFEPPEPPPLPEASGATKASWTLLIGGVLFLVARTLLEWNTPPWTFWLAVGGVFGGIVSLVARMRPDRDDYDDPDHGAVV
jgi:hypothetical protein